MPLLAVSASPAICPGGSVGKNPPAMWETWVWSLGREDPREDGKATHSSTGLCWWLSGEESTCNVGDLSSIPGLGRSPGEGKGYPVQYSGLENSMDCIVRGLTKSWTQLSSFHFHIASQAPDLPSWKIHFNKISRWLSCTSRLETLLAESVFKIPVVRLGESRGCTC